MTSYLVASGPFVWPLLITAAAALTLAVRCAARPRHTPRTPALAATAGTLLLGLLGTVLGAQKAISALPLMTAEERWLVWLGVSEALNTTVLAMVVALLVAVALGVAGYRLRGLVPTALPQSTATV